MSQAWNGVDDAHEDLVSGLVRAHKPQSVLELGLGSGGVTEQIALALVANGQPCDYTLVDNWTDFDGEQPPGLEVRFPWKINIVTSLERDFVKRKVQEGQGYDFIFSDADHTAAEQWFEDVYFGLLQPGGILIYHDVNVVDESFINLRELLYKCQETGISHKLFNRNSLPDEKCQRGLLVIFKP